MLRALRIVALCVALIETGCSEAISLPPNSDISETPETTETVQTPQTPEHQFFVDPSHPQASDEQDGTADQPFATLQRAADLAQPGDEILISGGPFTLDTTRHADPVLNITTDGTADAPIVFRAIGDEPVIIDANGDHFEAVWIHANYIQLEGITAIGAKRWGFLIEDATGIVVTDCIARNNALDGQGVDGGFQIIGPSRDCVLERCESLENGTGFTIGVKNAEENPEGITLRDCVAHNNQVDDEDSDGFSLIQVKNCSLIRCVAYANADDGINTQGPDCDNIILDRCVAYDSNPQHTVDGDGNGFKLSVGGPSIGYVVTRCVAFDNATRGFDDGDAVGTVYYHNTAFRNERWGFLFEGEDAIVVNNIAVRNYPTNPAGDAARDAKSSRTGAVAQSEHNLWGDGVFIAGLDKGSLQGTPQFISTEMIVAILDMNDSDFADVAALHLDPSSRGIDAGKDVGQPFSGAAPDLGAYETP